MFGQVRDFTTDPLICRFCPWIAVSASSALFPLAAGIASVIKDAFQIVTVYNGVSLCILLLFSHRRFAPGARNGAHARGQVVDVKWQVAGWEGGVFRAPRPRSTPG